MKAQEKVKKRNNAHNIVLNQNLQVKNPTQELIISNTKFLRPKKKAQTLQPGSRNQK
jgi:hypothetical protein